MPLVFADVDLSALRLDKARIEPVINCLRRRFTDQLSGLSQDPSGPAYLAMWQQAQLEIDSMLKGMIGINAFRQYEVAANAGLRNKQASAR